MKANVFITGGTGYLGRALIPELLAHGHTVRALVRRGSESKLPAGAIPVFGNALDAATFQSQIAPSTVFVQLVGVPHPSPAKARQFREIDGVSVCESVRAAKQAGVKHFIYVSVAQPAPIMRVYIEVRQEGERLIGESGMPATILRPWYILGPGHWWPLIIQPLYRLAALFPATRASAERLGYVSLLQMIAALVSAVETSPASGVQVWEVPEIRNRG